MDKIDRYFRSVKPRRSVLRDLGTAAASCVAAATLGSSGCGNPDDERESASLTVSLDELQPGQRVVVRHGNKPVELMRQGDRVIARSLVCTHIGCIVQWDPDENLYVCPCHRGRFDENGQVVDGPPTRPLAEISTQVSGTHVVLGG
jgi:cytochrome b6-f complex iron-sulfur subunit